MGWTRMSRGTAGAGNPRREVFLADRSEPDKILARSAASPPDSVFEFRRVPSGRYIAYSEGWISQPVDVIEGDIDNLGLIPAPGCEFNA